MLSADTTAPPARSASARASADFPAAVGPKMATTWSTATDLDGDRGGDRAAERHRRRPVDPHVDERARAGVPGEDDGLVLPRPAAQVVGVGPRRSLDEHL